MRGNSFKRGSISVTTLLVLVVIGGIAAGIAASVPGTAWADGGSALCQKGHEFCLWTRDLMVRDRRERAQEMATALQPAMAAQTDRIVQVIAAGTEAVSTNQAALAVGQTQLLAAVESGNGAVRDELRGVREAVSTTAANLAAGQQSIAAALEASAATVRTEVHEVCDAVNAVHRVMVQRNGQQFLLVPIERGQRVSGAGTVVVAGRRYALVPAK